MQVVIIDDTEINLTLLRHFVGKIGDCAVLTFADPQLGLAHCLRDEPDLLVVDYMMPGLNGLELIERFRAAPGRADVPIVMVSANDHGQLRQQALAAGASDFLPKPIDKTAFQGRVRELLALRAGQRRQRGRADWLAGEIRKVAGQGDAGERDTIVRLARTAEFPDADTGPHVQRMAHYCWLIAGRLGLPAAQRQLLLAAAPMHDVGKVAVAERVLLKPGPLDAAEMAQVRQHPAIGHQLLAGAGSALLDMAAEIALCHHERYDGGGYPRALAGAAIPLCGRIVAVADVFDALTSTRPYRAAWDVPQALDFLREQRGRHFDPACVDALLSELDAVLAARRLYPESP
jgi:response regulator RpfG family c-di-GMP phosphodiesterase